MEYSDVELINLSIEGSEDAKNFLYNKYKYIINILLKKYAPLIKKYNIDYHEVEQEALYAFSDALSSFRLDKDVKLQTFITICIDRKLKKIIRKYSGDKAKLLNNVYSLDYDYNEDGVTLKDVISDNLTNDPLYSLEKEENYEELLNTIKKELSESEYEIFKYLANGFDIGFISEITGKSYKQTDNTTQRVKNKIRDIINRD